MSFAVIVLIISLGISDDEDIDCSFRLKYVGLSGVYFLPIIYLGDEMRKWEDLENDEIYGIWHSYLSTEFQGYNDPCRLRPDFKQAIRLTPMEIIKLVDELLIRLEAKEKRNEKV